MDDEQKKRVTTARGRLFMKLNNVTFNFRLFYKRLILGTDVYRQDLILRSSGQEVG